MKIFRWGGRGGGLILMLLNISTSYLFFELKVNINTPNETKKLNNLVKKLGRLKNILQMLPIHRGLASRKIKNI